MNGGRAGWVSALVVMSVLSLSRAPGEPSAAPRGEGKDETAKPASTKPQEPSWDEPARLTSALTGRIWEDFKQGEKSWKDLAALAREAGFSKVEPVIALLPCPLESNLSADFDQSLAAIQEAYADGGYILVGWALPWTGDAAKERLETSNPGMLVFRRFDGRDLAVVLLVGEVPALGVHREAFREAVAAARSWRSGPEPIRILGPFLSDSAVSLQLGIEEQKGQGLQFEIMTGSAVAKTLGDRPWNQLGSPVTLQRTVVPEDEMQERARRFFKDEMHWNPRQVALLTEADNAYGQPYLTKENASDFLIVHFPPGIGGVRNAWDQDSRPSQSSGSAAKEGIKVPETTLGLSLGDRGKPVLPQALSALTWTSRDLAIANLLAALPGRRISYVGILALDARDAVFLMERVRRFCPSAVVFLIDNNLLYTHPKLAESMNGALVISSYTLFAQDCHLCFDGQAKQRYLHQFTSDVHQGIYQATLRLMPGGGGRAVEPEVWVSAIGNGSLWPVARLDRLDQNRTGPRCPLRPWAPEPASDPEAVKLLPLDAMGRSLLLSAIVLLLLMVSLQGHAIPPAQAGRQIWLALAAAIVTLGLAAESLLVIGSLPFRRLGLPLADWKPILAAFLLIGALAYLTRIFITAMIRSRSIAVWLGIGLAVLCLAAGVFVGLDQILCRLWMLGGAAVFLRRAITISSSLSPLVSLMWLGGALFNWSFVELRRYRMQAVQAVAWPSEALAGPAVKECDHDVGKLRKLLSAPWPEQPHLRSLRVLIVPFFSSLLLVLVPIHPIAEPVPYGEIFIVMLGIAYFLSVYSFCRFLAAWLILKRILQRLSLPHPPEGLTEDLAKLVGWSPMRSFGRQIPHFKMAILVADQLRHEEGLDAAIRQQLDQALDRAVKAYGDGDVQAEIDAREDFRQALNQACEELAKGEGTQARQTLAALWLISYVRYIFAHLRGCLIATGASGFPLLIAASTYAFEPNEFVSNWVWVSLLIGVLITVWMFFDMDRNETLSLISGTAPGKVQLDWHFARNILSYGVIPLLGLIASQFPQVGRYLISLVNPLLQAVGGGG